MMMMITTSETQTEFLRMMKDEEGGEFGFFKNDGR